MLVDVVLDVDGVSVVEAPVVLVPAPEVVLSGAVEAADEVLVVAGSVVVMPVVVTAVVVLADWQVGLFAYLSATRYVIWVAAESK